MFKNDLETEILTLELKLNPAIFSFMTKNWVDALATH